MEIKVKKLHPDAIVPQYATAGSACFDLHAIDGDAFFHTGKFRTGLSFEIPHGHVMLIYSRSGHGFKSDIRLANCVGVIDSDYRGEVQVKLTNDGLEDGFEVNPGDRIAQAMIIPVPTVSLVEVEALSDTDRGEGGFGSTGK